MAPFLNVVLSDEMLHDLDQHCVLGLRVSMGYL